MKSPLHILHLEDDPNDAALVQSEFRSGPAAGGSGTGILPVQRWGRRCGRFFPGSFTAAAGWKPVLLSEAVSASEFGLNERGIVGIILQVQDVERGFHA